MSPSHIWHGTAQAVTLHDAKGAVVWEGALTPSREAPGLPLAHPFVAGWLDAGLLTPVPAEVDDPAPARRKSTRATAAEAAQEG